MHKNMCYICFHLYLWIFLEMQLWIKLLPEMDFLVKIKLKQGITLVIFIS